MTPPPQHLPTAPLDWDEVDLVVFDVDGTLYDQRALRLTMLRELLSDAWRSRSLDVLRTLRTFRKVREALGDEPGAEFLRLQYSRTASSCRKTEDEVRTIATEWMEERPLARLAACRYPNLEALFTGLRSRGKQVAVFSDYPAVAKLAALGLHADPVICATDPEIGRLKPDPTGLLAILLQTGVPARRTLMIGDRIDRDAAAAQMAGVRALIRARSPHPEFETFRAYDDPVFQPLLSPHSIPAAA